ncbi:MAG: hypothetical protein ACE5JA_06865, partial [bacterium]
SLAHAEPAMPDSIVRVGACATPEIAWGVFVQGDYARVADQGYLTVMNVKPPTTPLVAGSVDPSVGIPVGVFVIDTVAYKITASVKVSLTSV